MTGKESQLEWNQILARRLSRGDLHELAYGLRKARRELHADGCISPRTRTHLDGIGVDWSKLIPDMDGDAPDRFDSTQKLDWKWKPRPKSTAPYHSASPHPRFGDRVHREYSAVLGTVCAWKSQGRGYLVRVDWDDAPMTAVAMSRLVLVSAFHCEVEVLIAHPKKLSLRARVTVRVDEGPPASTVFTLPPARADNFEAYVEALDEAIAPLLPAFGNDRDALLLRASSILRPCLLTFDEDQRHFFDVQAFAWCVGQSIRGIAPPPMEELPAHRW